MKLKARVRLFEGKRKNPVPGPGYCPHLRTIGSEMMGVRFLGALWFEASEVEFETIFDGVDYSSLVVPNTIFAILEGPKVVGMGRILEEIAPYAVVHICDVEEQPNS